MYSDFWLCFLFPTALVNDTACLFFVCCLCVTVRLLNSNLRSWTRRPVRPERAWAGLSGAALLLDQFILVRDVVQNEKSLFSSRALTEEFTWTRLTPESSLVTSETFFLFVFYSCVFFNWSETGLHSLIHSFTHSQISQWLKARLHQPADGRSEYRVR